MKSWKQIVAKEHLETIDDSKDGINLLMKNTLNVHSESRLNVRMGEEVPGPKTVTETKEEDKRVLGNQEQQKKRTVMDFKAILQQGRERADKQTMSGDGEKVSRKEDRNTFSEMTFRHRFGSKRTVASRRPMGLPDQFETIRDEDEHAQLDGNFVKTSNDNMEQSDVKKTSEFDFLADENSRKRPQVLVDEDTNSKRPRLEAPKPTLEAKTSHKSDPTKVRARKSKFLFKFDRIENWASDTDDSRTGTGSNISMALDFSRLSNSAHMAAASQQKEPNNPLATTGKEGQQQMQSTAAGVSSNAQTPEPNMVATQSPATPDECIDPVKELTEARLQKRQRQIDLGKETKGYANFRKFFPKPSEEHPETVTGTQESDVTESERLTVRKDAFTFDIFPTTPRKETEISKRQWDVRIRRWRRSLHLYDDVVTLEQFQEIANPGSHRRDKKVTDYKRRVHSRRKRTPVKNGFVHTPVLSR